MHILHLEDSDTDAELSHKTIRREWPECSIVHVTGMEDYTAALRDARYDLILSDYSIPGFDGLSALAEARNTCPQIPFLFLSGTIGEERAVEALKRGAADYVLKDRPQRLVPAIRQALALVAETKQRRDAEGRVREQAHWLDKARDAILATDLELRITYWNAGAERLHRRPASAVVGRKLDELALQPDQVDRFAAARAEVIARGEWRGEFRVRDDSGAPRIIESNWCLVKEDDGRPRSILVIESDATDRKCFEAQLARAQRMESIGTLASGIAHDLNNVLTPILLGMDLLDESVSAPEDHQIISQTRASATHGAALLNQLLAFARGGAAGQRTRVSPDHALARVVRLAGQNLSPAVQLVLQHNQSPWPVEVNPTQFDQVLINLALNARDAMPDGGRLSITTENLMLDAARAAANPGTTPGPFVRISVADTGRGIPPALLPRIFDPFFTTKPPGRGTGLGLSVVAGILKGHGGFVEVESTAGRGTTFHLYFPALPRVVPAAPSPVTPAAVDRPFGASRAQDGAGVLLVDDEPAVRETLRLVLQRAGYATVAVADAGSAWSEFQERRSEIDLVITDMMLPDGSGLDVVRQLRSLAPELPIVAISGMMASGRFDELRTLTPPVECLAKPLAPRVLLAAAERALQPVAG